MYGAMDNLQGRRPVFRKPEKPPVKRRSTKRCLKKCGNALYALYLRLRATVLILLATLGLPVFYLTLHFLLNPSLATLAAHLQPAFCTVASSAVHEGKNICTWSSCRQGCTTQELYICWHVLILVLNTSYDVNQTFSGYVTGETVRVTPLVKIREQSETFTEMKINNDTISEEAQDESVTNTHIVIGELTAGQKSTDEMLAMDVLPRDQQQEAGLARLKINAQGCTYRSCEVWWTKYNRVGTTFSCYVSADGDLAVPDVDYDYVMMQAILGVLPLVLGAASVLIMYGLYWRKGSTDTTLRLSPDPKVQQTKWEEARVRILLQQAMDQQNQPQKFDATLVMNVNNAKKLKNKIGEPAVETQQAWADDEEGKEQKRKLFLARRWRQIAAIATHHPTVSQARRFPEVTLDL